MKTGKWGMATNNYRLTVPGELPPGDIVEKRLWLEYANNEVWILKCDWLAISRDGKITRVALTEMGFSAVKILGHGVAKIESMPQQLRDFFTDMLPKTDAVSPLEELPSRYKQFKLVEVVWQRRARRTQSDRCSAIRPCRRAETAVRFLALRPDEFIPPIQNKVFQRFLSNNEANRPATPDDSAA